MNNIRLLLLLKIKNVFYKYNQSTIVYKKTYHSPPECIRIAGKIVSRFPVFTDRIFFGQVYEVAAKY